MKRVFIFAGIILLLAGASPSLGAESTPSNTLQETFTQLEHAIQTTKEAAGAEHAQRWTEIEHFQMSLWRAMALDPSSIAPVPVSQVPKNLFAAELNADLTQQFEEIKKSTYPKTLGVEAEFSQYVVAVQEILNLRKARQFPQARAIAKRGVLDAKFDPISKKLTFTPSGQTSAVTDSWVDVDESLKTVREQVNAKENTKKDLFNSGNQFTWFATAAFFGFLLGLATLSLNPGFFQRFFASLESTVPSATTHSVGNRQLDYARWLREFEEILSRLKSSQLSHERRIEDLVSQSEKVSQQINGMASDARIKNEASLEFRMASILKGVQSQVELGHKLQGGDRAQINLMLEHCLTLCDAVEAGAIHYDRSRVEEPALRKSA